MTVTLAPALASQYAVAGPAMEAPTTSTRRSVMVRAWSVVSVLLVMMAIGIFLRRVLAMLYIYTFIRPYLS
jgi:uncharacterized membrane protein